MRLPLFGDTEQQIRAAKAATNMAARMWAEQHGEGEEMKREQEDG